jgi:hypothetical protein
MSAKLKLSVVGFILTILLTGFWTSQPPLPPKQSTLAVMKIDDVWRVVNSADSSCTVIVNKNDKIIWTVDGTNAEFHFNDSIFDSSGSSYNVKNGHKLQLKIKGDVQPGSYEYSVFCDADSVYAIGCSPPVIIVQ